MTIGLEQPEGVKEHFSNSRLFNFSLPSSAVVVVVDDDNDVDDDVVVVVAVVVVVTKLRPFL